NERDAQTAAALEAPERPTLAAKDAGLVLALLCLPPVPDQCRHGPVGTGAARSGVREQTGNLARPPRGGHGTAAPACAGKFARWGRISTRRHAAAGSKRSQGAACF